MMVIGTVLISIMMVVVVPKVTTHLREPRSRAPLVHRAPHRRLGGDVRPARCSARSSSVLTVNLARKALAVGPDGKARGSIGFTVIAIAFAAA